MLRSKFKHIRSLLACTMTVNVGHEAVSPEGSVTVYVTLYWPESSDWPGSRVVTRVNWPELSEAVGGTQLATA